MNAFCLVLLLSSCSLSSVLGDSHLACPASRACPDSSAPFSSEGSGTCEDSLASASRNTIRSSTTTALNGYLNNNNAYFQRRRAAYIGQNRLFPASSCAEIKETFPGNTSSYYWVGDKLTYCTFDLDTPSDVEGWERIMFLDMSDESYSCPENFRVIEPPEDRGRYCIKEMTTSGCTGIMITPGTGQFSRVYGRIYGIHIGTADVIVANRGINDAYLDGVSLTTNNGGNRQHIWSFSASQAESFAACPCSTGSTNTVPGFVGPDYFCESGKPRQDADFFTAYVDDMLWDGVNCNDVEAACCAGMIGSASSPPWFYKTFNNPVQTGTNVEVRVCTNQDITDENMGIQLVELYVQ